MQPVKCPVCGMIYLGYDCPNQKAHNEAFEEMPDALATMFGIKK